MFNEIKKVLITIKTYPNPSRKYQETVCVAGIDLDSNKWIRLYPIPFRDLDEDKKFKKYNIIEVKVNKSTDDHRPESYKIDIGSIKILDHFDTDKDKKWSRRKEIVLHNISKSMCEILKESELNNKSLGIFKPVNIDFYWEKAKEKDQDEKESYYAQTSLLNKDKTAPEQIPFEFRYKFKCLNEPDCAGHDFLIIDWEIGQAYRSWRRNYPSQEILLNQF